MILDRLFRAKVQCLTCKEHHFKADCNAYPYENWAGGGTEYECKVCAVTRAFEGKPLQCHSWIIEEMFKARQNDIGMM